MCTICALCGQSAVLTAVRCRAIPGLMQTLPLKKLRNFGGKLGAELEKLGQQYRVALKVAKVRLSHTLK